MIGILLALEMVLILGGVALLFFGFTWHRVGRMAGIFGLKTGHQWGFPVAMTGIGMLVLGMLLTGLNPSSESPEEVRAPIENANSSLK